MKLLSAMIKRYT